MEKKWEYMSFVCSGEELERALNPLGEQRWELVGMAIIADIREKPAHYMAYNAPDNYRLVLKRQKE